MTVARAGDALTGSPGFTGRLAGDRAALSAFVRSAEAVLDALPPGPERSAAQRARAEEAHRECRRARKRFMAAHAEEVYAELAGGADPSRLDGLVFSAAEAFPGLVPTRAQMAEERRHVQLHREGREIDQAIFFAGVLRAPGAGTSLVRSMLRPTPRAVGLLPEFRAKGRLDLGVVEIERRDGAAHLTMNNRTCLNAEDDRLTGDMETAVDLALLDGAVRVGVLRGGPMTHPKYRGRRVFSAGINLRRLRAGRITFVDFLLGRELGYISKLVRGLAADGEGEVEQVVKPWLGAVDSFAIGGGMQLLLVFDRVVAESDAYFSLPAAQEGIVPGAGALRLGRLTGGRLARQIILGGRRVSARDPEARSLCDEVVDGAEMDEAVERGVRLLDDPAVVANRVMLNLAEEPIDRFRLYMADFTLLQARRIYDESVIATLERFGKGRHGDDHA
ncbi:(3,5-dihydroxyphenyl)acetyl-CoA 1,2-dioxygenase DpgC [Actinomadura sp. 9N215]|uniref:(3,5-dihydroxyphenyl)acetyl-CoA 1,2-dioxygenase DpgC n=1 Tax=Actinomadura sp. 9N215 TaxID=3375150 RepID=UPI0037A09D45